MMESSIFCFIRNSSLDRTSTNTENRNNRICTKCCCYFLPLITSITLDALCKCYVKCMYEDERLLPYNDDRLGSWKHKTPSFSPWKSPRHPPTTVSAIVPCLSTRRSNFFSKGELSPGLQMLNSMAPPRLRNFWIIVLARAFGANKTGLLRWQWYEVTRL